jgi:LacI family transcriptional regulator
LRTLVVDAMCLFMAGTNRNGQGAHPSGKPTIDDVARHASVSRTTVSRVLNNGANVRPAVREKVLKSVEALDFKVNVQARVLAGRSGGSIALVHQSDLDTEPNSYYHAALELGAMRACLADGFQVLTATVSPDVKRARQQIEEMFDDGRISGMILTPPLSDDAALSELAERRGFAIAYIAADPAFAPAGPVVGIDDFTAGRDLARYLIELGHRRFGYIHGLAGHRSAELRFVGLRAALQEAGIAKAEIDEERGTFTFKSGIECTERILARQPRPTALMCANDDMAAGALLALHRAGLDIPGDISVTGFDGTPISEIVWPPLTTVLQPIKQIGHDAASRLLVWIAASADARPTERQVVEHRLLVRESTAPPSL